MMQVWIYTDIFMDMTHHAPPSSLAITPEILNLTAETDGFKGDWEANRNLTPERLSALRHVSLSAYEQ